MTVLWVPPISMRRAVRPRAADGGWRGAHQRHAGRSDGAIASRCWLLEAGQLDGRGARPAAPGTGSPGGDGWRGGEGRVRLLLHRAGRPTAGRAASRQRHLSTGPAPAGGCLIDLLGGGPGGESSLAAGMREAELPQGSPRGGDRGATSPSGSAISPPPMSALRCAAADLRPARPQQGRASPPPSRWSAACCARARTGAGNRHRSGPSPRRRASASATWRRSSPSTSSSPWPRTSPSSPVSTACSAATSRRGSTPW